MSHCIKSVQIRSFFWSVFSRIWTELYSVRMRENTDQKTPYLDTFLASFKPNTLSDIKPVFFERTYEIIMRSSYFKMIMYITTALRKIWENAVQLKYVVFLHIFRSATVFIRISASLRCYCDAHLRFLLEMGCLLLGTFKLTSCW